MSLYYCQTRNEQTEQAYNLKMSCKTYEKQTAHFDPFFGVLFINRFGDVKIVCCLHLLLKLVSSKVNLFCKWTRTAKKNCSMVSFVLTGELSNGFGTDMHMFGNPRARKNDMSFSLVRITEYIKNSTAFS